MPRDRTAPLNRSTGLQGPVAPKADQCRAVASRAITLMSMPPRRDGVQVKLTSHEFRVLSYLMHHRTRVVSQAELTEHIYAQDFERDSNTVEVFIARLRRKLGASIIETVRGIGYRVTS